jgi:predicted HicB family RNase H-like nuclease
MDDVKTVRQLRSLVTGITLLQESQIREGTLSRAATKSKRSDGPRMVHVRLEPDLHRRLRIVVAAEDTSVQDWIVQLVEKAVTEQWPKVAKEGE